MDQYESFARYYDATLGNRKMRVAGLLRDLIKRHHPNAKTILEIACGTGNIIGELQSDFEVEGLDLSHAMVTRARDKLPRVTIHEADMTTFSLEKRFDVILCIFDSINHLLRREAWEATIARAAEHLAEGGIFIVDVNTQRLFETFAKEKATVTAFGEKREHVLIEDALQTEPYAVEWIFWYFIQKANGDYERSNVLVPEISFPLEDVKQMLGRHFSNIAVYDHLGNDTVDEAMRWYFVCKK